MRRSADPVPGLPPVSPGGSLDRRASRSVVRAGAFTAVLLGAWCAPGVPGHAAAGTAAVGSPAPSSPVRATACIPTLPRGSSVRSLVVDSVVREVRVHVPTRADGERLPLAIGFHGYTATAAQLEVTSDLTARAESDEFLVAYVQGAGEPPDWSFPAHAGSRADDLGLVASLIDQLIAEACADPARVVLFGHSMGGGMASAAACALADRVAGVVLVSAFWADLPCVPARPVPVVAMHALDDPVLPYDGGMVGGGGPRVRAVEEALGAWAERDGCDPDPSTRGLDGGVVELAWGECAAPVRLLRASAGGHDWAPAASAQVVAMLLGSPAVTPSDEG